MSSGNIQSVALAEILQACRKLSNTLDLEQLYMALADVIRKKFSIHRLAIFLYRQTTGALELVFSKGLGEPNFQIKKNKSRLWKSILSGELFKVTDEAGNMLFPAEFEKHGVEALQSKLWAPLGMRDELVGLVTLQAILATGDHYLAQQGRTSGVPERERIHAAVLSLGLDDLGRFDPDEKIIEYRYRGPISGLQALPLHAFADELSGDSPAPGGGSVAALAGALSAALSALIGNLTHGLKGHEEAWEAMSRLAAASNPGAVHWKPGRGCSSTPSLAAGSSASLAVSLQKSSTP